MFDSVSLLRHLPSAANFRLQIIEDLKYGRSVLCFLNSKEQVKQISEFCLSGIHQSELYFIEVDLSRNEAPLYPVNVLRKQFISQAPDSPIAAPLRDFVLEGELPDVIVIDGLAELPLETRDVWFEFFQRWAEAVHSVSSTAERKPPCLLGMSTIKHGEALPIEETWLRIHWWWSILSILEVRILCRLREGNSELFLSTQASWRESVLPSFAGNDLALIEHLWDDIFQRDDHILKRLIAFAQDRNWTFQKLYELGVDNYLHRQRHRVGRFAEVPKLTDRILWANGLLNQTVESGILVSSAALAVLGEEDEIRHRLWHGQSALILPIVNGLRLSICKALTQRHGTSWSVKWSPPQSKKQKELLEQNPLVTEWGRLENALRKCPDRSERRYLRPVKHAREIRNTLAHYQPISFQDYQLLLNLTEDL